MGSRVVGKVAFITGAARGQGRSHALRLAEEGADIIGVDVCDQVETVPYAMATSADLTETARMVNALGRRIVTTKVDVRDRDGLLSALDAGVAELGRLDIVVANAGIWSHARAAGMASTMWQDVIDINLTGVFNTCQAALPHLIEARRGSIILISSTAGLRGHENNLHYVAAKHGVVGIMRNLAHELGRYNIRVNTVHPTSVDTDMIRNDSLFKLFRPDLSSPTMDDLLPAMRSINLLRTPWVDPIDISNAVLFLSSDESRFITSVSLPVDAGSTQR